MSKKKNTITDDASYNVEAAQWAAHNAGATCQDLTEEQKSAFRQTVVNFKKKPGFTIGDVPRTLLFDCCLS